MSDTLFNCTYCNTVVGVRAHRLLPNGCPNCGETEAPVDHFKLFREMDL